MSQNTFFLLNGGQGTRFSEVYSLNKPNILIFGTPMYKLVLESLFKTVNINKDSQNLYMVIHNNDESKMMYYDILKDYNINNIFLDYFTRGPIETCKLAINSYKNTTLYDNEIIWFLDNDILYCEDINWNININENEMCLLIQEIEEPLEGLSNQYSPYSHVKIKDSYIIDIVEKVFISKYIVIGAYGFGSIKLFNDMFEIFNENIKNTEWYMSLLVKTAIDNNIKIKYIMGNNNISVGIPEQVNDAIKNNKIIPKKLRWVFDLDNTIVSFPKIKNDYDSVEPITEIIEFINSLYNNGHYIIIYTARNMKTKSKTYINTITKDIIIKTLKKFNVNYHELVLEKPYGDMYVDDKSVNPLHLRHTKWKTNAIGFGYDNMIYDKNKINNKIFKLDNDICYKIASHNEMIGYTYFINNCSAKILNHVPKFYDCKSLNNGFYKIIMEWKKSIPISKLYYNNLLTDIIFDKIFKLMNDLHYYKIYNDKQYDEYVLLNYFPKLLNRIYKYDIYKSININVDAIRDFFDSYKPFIINCIHGDFWFNNLLWSEEDNKVYMIDMRGLIGDNTTTIGDMYYDYSKLYQSICGFDCILYTGNKLDKNIHEKYKNKFIYNLNLLPSEFDNIKKITAFLMLGSIPFHDINDKQLKLILQIIKENWEDVII